MFYQGGPIDHCTHVTGLVSQYGAESEFNAAFTSVMVLEHFRIPNNELINKVPYVVPEQAPLIILDRKSVVCITKNGKYTKHTRHISRIMNLVINGEECNLHKMFWCEGGLQLVDIGTENVRED